MNATNEQTPALAGYLINPTTRTVKAVKVPENDQLATMYRLLDCPLVEVVAMRTSQGGPMTRMDAWVNEEALPDAPVFLLQLDSTQPRLQPLRGNCLILGHNPSSGDCTDAPEDIDAVIERVWWMTSGAGFIRADKFVGDLRWCIERMRG